MKIIDAHVHLGNIYGLPVDIPLESRIPETTHPGKLNLYEQMGFGNVYFGKLNYLFKPWIAAAAKKITPFANLPNLLDSMKKNRIGQAVVLPVEPYVPTERVLSICRQNPELIPFCSVHPYDQQKCEKLRRYLKAGCRGLKLHPVIQQFPPDDPAVFDLLEEVKSCRIPVLWHTGWGSIGRGSFGSIKYFRNVLKAFPGIKFILAHLGFYEPNPFIDFAAQHDNLFFDISWQPAGIIRRALDKVGEDRLLYGSDWPYNLQNTSLEIILKLTANDQSRREKLLGQNIQRLLDLDRGIVIRGS